MNRSPYSPTFRLFHRAILDRQQMTMVYDGKRREVCPYILGHTKGKEVALVYQFGGDSSRPGSLPNWRCFHLADVTAAATRDGPWHGDAAHRQRQACVDEVYIDVNTEVPNQPGRRLAIVSRSGQRRNMKEIILDAARWTRPDDFYDALLPALGAPPWHGRNLDALHDSISGNDINDVHLPYRISIVNSAQTPQTVWTLLQRFAALVADLQTEGISVELKL